MGFAEWLEVAAGLLPETKTRELMRHAAQCGHCGPLLKNAAEALGDEATPNEEALLASLQSARPEWRKNMAAKLRDSVQDGQRRSSWRRAVFAWPTPAYAFAGIVAVALVAWIGVRALYPPSAEQLLAQAYSEHRTLEVRIPGARYAPMQAERGTAQSDFDRPHSLLKAEDVIGEALSKNPNAPNWLQARARAELLDGNYESAIKSLQRALETQPDSPSLLTDLGSAYFMRAESADRPIDYGNAIESFGKALAKSPDDPIALFNRAVACQRMFLYTQAVDDWEHYLRVDTQGEWANDARRRLNALKEKLQQHEKGQSEPLLSPAEIAKGAGNVNVREKIDEQIEEYLRVAVAEWLPKAYPARATSGADAEGVRTALRVVADIAAQNHGDRWLGDLLAPPAAFFAAAVVELSSALKANESGDNVAARQHASSAEQLFASVGDDAGVLRARVEYLFAFHDAQEGNACLRVAQGLNQRMAASPYAWLRTQFYIEQGTCFWLVGNLGKCRESYERAERDARASGYRVIFLRTQDHLSALSSETGDFSESANRTESALARFWSGKYPAMRGYNLYYQIRETSRLTNRPHLQMAAWRDGLLLSNSFSDTVLRAMAHSAMGDAAIAADVPRVAEEEYSQARELFAVSPQIKSTQVAKIEAEIRLAEVENSLGRATESTARLRSLEAEVAGLSDVFLAILFYTTLGDAATRAGDANEAESALRSALTLAELQLRSLHGDKARIDWETRISTAYRDFVQLRLLQGDPQGALEIWEWYRGIAPRAQKAMGSDFRTRDSLLEPHTVTSQLPALTKETVVSYAALPEGLAVWVYDNRGIFTYWTGWSREHGDVETQAARFRSLCSNPQSDISALRQNARALYDLLVAPIEDQLAPGRVLVIELDDRLTGLPFDALIDKQGHYLSERGPIALSLGIYYGRDGRASLPITAESSVLVASVPVSPAIEDASFVPLPDANSEAAMVAQDFHSAQLLAGRQATTASVISGLPDAEVFHFAGHAFNSLRKSGLLLSDAVLDTSALEKTSLSRLRLAVFSACETEDGSTGGAYASDSMVRVFLRAGVPAVVASRWNVDSVATRQLMGLFYGALLDGSTIPEAIQRAQSALRSRPGMGHPYYWSAFAAFETT
jgi:CHAT domain-containing protein/Flp pilus assembly protein TadD